MAVDFRKKLAAANKAWKGAKKKATESKETEFEDGKYLAKLMSGTIGQAESSGRLQITWEWAFQEEPYEGKKIRNYQGLENEDNLVFLARDLERLGYEAPDDLSGIEEVLADITKTKPLARIRVKTKGDFQNVYIDKVIGDDDEEDDEAEEEAEAETEESDEEEESEEEADDAEESDDEEESDDAEEESDDAEEEEAEEESDDDADDDEVEIEVGMKVEADTKKGKVKGEIIEIFEKEEKVRVKVDDGGVVKLGLDKVALLASEEPAKKPATKAKAVKAPAPAPAPVKKKVKAKK